MPKSEPPSFHIRLSPSLLKRIKRSAVENDRSINAEITERLEGSFEMSDGARQKIRSLISELSSVLDKGER